jgi:3-oxoacyl-[acyl-carrier-protein] synthase II
VHAHATSTPVGDRLEADAIRTVLGSQVPVTSSKSLTGHLLGGAGALGAVVMIEALRTGSFPGTCNLETPGDGVDLNIVKKTVSGLSATAGITNAFGFGGHSTALVITKS